MRIPDEHGWEVRKSLGLKADIKDAMQYALALEAGVKHAKNFLQEHMKTPHFDPDGISKIHWLVFKDIYPWAGKFRESEPKWTEFAVSESKLIVTDLKSLHLQSKCWFGSTDLNRTAKEIAAYNAGLQSIGPFVNGIQAVARVASEHQAFLKFERAINLESDYGVYISALKQACKGNITPLASQILGHAGLSRAAERQRVENVIETATQELKDREQKIYRSR